MSGMVERVAKAICLAAGEDPDALGDYEGEGVHPRWWIWLTEARAAIKAMREPTAEMREAGASAFMQRDLDDPDSEPIRDSYRAMIDTALEKQS